MNSASDLRRHPTFNTSREQRKKLPRSYPIKQTYTSYTQVAARNYYSCETRCSKTTDAAIGRPCLAVPQHLNSPRTSKMANVQARLEILDKQLDDAKRSRASAAERRADNLKVGFFDKTLVDRQEHAEADIKDLQKRIAALEAQLPTN